MIDLWQADWYRNTALETTENPRWELLICDSAGKVIHQQTCLQTEVNAEWLIQQLQQITLPKPTKIQVFRPQCLGLFEIAGKSLNIVIEPTRRTFALKQQLQTRTTPNYNPLALDKPPPVPIPEQLWGEKWRFATLPAGELIDAFIDRPIPILEMPELLFPVNLGLASTTPIPGIVIDGGRQSRRLALWLQDAKPVSIHYIPGTPDGLILEAGLIDRWVLVTFEDTEVASAGQVFEQRKQQSSGLHFLLVQPDDSGITYTGFWLLQPA